MSNLPVTVIPTIGPDFGREVVQAPQGLSVSAIVDMALPELKDSDRSRLRVWLVSERGEMLLSEPGTWDRIYPAPGARVMIRIVAGKNALRSVLQIVVLIAAFAIGQFWVGPALAGLTGSALLGQIGAGVATAGLALAGQLAINRFIPPAQPAAQAAGQEQQVERPLYQISDWRNQSTPDGVVPSILGEVRVAPVFAAPSYSEIVGDEQYLRTFFLFGYGQVELSDFRIKDTPLENFDGVQIEVREGLDTDEPVTLYPSQVIQDSLGVELRRDQIRNSVGTIISAGPITPVTRFTAADCTEVNLLFHFPSGLIKYNDQGTAQTQSVDVSIRQRPASGGDWQDVTTLGFRARKSEGFFRQYKWTLPSRGRWEIEVARTTNERDTPNQSDRVSWLGLQSFRPEYPINFPKPLAVVAVRVKATYQLNSSLENFNALAKRVIPDWDHDTQSWITRATRNPASHFRHILQGPENTWPEPDSAIDLEAIQDWHDFCRLKDLKYDRDRSFEASTWDALTEIAVAGRATPRYDGTKWSVVIDRPQDLVVAHIDSRNSRNFTWSRDYVETPDAFRVRFLDKTADYQQRERIVRWPGHTGPIDITEELLLPGKTDPDEIWFETRRRQYETIYRPDVFSAVQDGAVRTATRGDLVKGNYTVLAKEMAALRVKSVHGQAVSLDGQVEMESGKSYALRFMRQIGEGESATFESVLRTVRTEPGISDTVHFSDGGHVPPSGALVQFGIAGEESIDLLIHGVQAGDQMTNVLSMLAHAPEIDTLTDAEIPPAWNGRAGGDASGDTAAPAVPVVGSIETNLDINGDPDGLQVLLSPGLGGAAVETYTLRHRLLGAGVWQEASGAAGAGVIEITGYSEGDTIEMQSQATSGFGIGGAWSDTFSAVVVRDLSDAPLPPTTATVVGGTGSATINVSTPNDTGIAGIRISYSANSDGSFETVLVTFAASANGNYNRVESVPAGTWYFFANTLSSNGTPSPAFALGQATIT